MTSKQLSLFDYLLNLIDTASKKRTIDKVSVKLFLKRIKEKKLIKKDNIDSHFCVFFLPVDIRSKMIYLCHHKKADDWIPPGGHIDENELPVQTVIRECKEELSITISEKQIEFFNISVKQIENQKHPCKTHYDLWYLISVHKQLFNYIKKEYYNARWVAVSDAKKYIKKNPDYLHIIELLNNRELYPTLKQ